MQAMRLRAMFEDHPVLHDYLMLNSEENISTEEELKMYYSNGRYRPLENSQDVFLMVTIMLVLNTKSGASRVNVAQLPFFNKVVKDIKVYV